jgi:hypothetical protein
MSRIGRILAVTAGLMAGGALFGAVAAVAALLIAVSFTGELGEVVRDADLLQLVAVVGALFGGVLFPTAGFIVLRRVPLWLALLGNLVGTVAGGVIGWLVPGRAGDQVIHAIIGALLGFLLATIALRLTVGRAARGEAVRVPAG